MTRRRALLRRRAEWSRLAAVTWQCFFATERFFSPAEQGSGGRFLPPLNCMTPPLIRLPQQAAWRRRENLTPRHCWLTAKFLSRVVIAAGDRPLPFTHRLKFMTPPPAHLHPPEI